MRLPTIFIAICLFAIAACASPEEETNIQEGTTTPPPTEYPYTLYYEDGVADFLLFYPPTWTASPLRSDARDIISAVEFISNEDGFRHASIYVFANPGDVTLRDWIIGHDPIFLDANPTDTTIVGYPALYSTVAEGLPSFHAYVVAGDRVYGVFALREQEFQDLTQFLTIGVRK